MALVARGSRKADRVATRWEQPPLTTQLLSGPSVPLRKNPKFTMCLLSCTISHFFLTLPSLWSGEEAACILHMLITCIYTRVHTQKLAHVHSLGSKRSFLAPLHRDPASFGLPQCSSLCLTDTSTHHCSCDTLIGQQQ